MRIDTAPSILFVVDGPHARSAPHNDNFTRLPDLFRQHQWEVAVCEDESLSVDSEGVHIAGLELNAFDVVWVLGFGLQSRYLDRVQILSSAQQVRFVSNPLQQMHLHGKAAWVTWSPKSVCSSDPLILKHHMARAPSPTGQWVLKPNAGSLGRGVNVVSSVNELTQLLEQVDQGTWILEPYKDMQKGELRTLIAGGEVLGSYLRRAAPGTLHNLSQDGQAEAYSPSTDEMLLVKQIHEHLIRKGIGFAAIDTVDGALMEVNVVNPGGLATMEDLYGTAWYVQAGAKLAGAINALIDQALP